MRHCELKHWNISIFLSLYREGKLRKPRIQRKKKWDLEQEKRYIGFLRRHKSSVMPFLVNEKILGSEKIYQMFDGNNRSNAILNFIERPFLYIPEFIPSEYSTEIKVALQNLSLEKLLKYRYFSKFCKENSLELIAEPQTENDELFGKMLDDLKEIDFTDCILSISVFNNLTGEEMRNIYEEVNQYGTPLTRQEILASSTDSILFTEDDLDIFSEIHLKVESYYNDMTAKDNEKLPIEKNVRGKCINLFEVLIGFQSLLHSRFAFVPQPGMDEKMDALFKIYELEYGSFEDKPDNINEFIRIIMKGCMILEEIFSSMFNKRINYKAIQDRSCLSLKKNMLVLLSIYFIANKQQLENDEFVKKIKRIVVYHTLVEEINNKEKKMYFSQFDSFEKIRVGGSFIGSQAKKLKETSEFTNVPEVKIIRDILLYLNTENIVNETLKPTKRKPLSYFKILLLSAFHDTRVPRASEAIMKNKDHIIPWSIEYSQENFDLDRLGNLQLIDEKTNKARGKKPITTEFIQKYNLQYQNYPSEEVYKQITDGKKIINIKLYNDMCEKREKDYIDILCSSL